MSRAEVYEKLLPVFRDVFFDRSIKIDDSTTARDIMGWDSLVHINLIASIEDEFGIKFSMQEAYGTKNVGELVDAILAHSGGN